ncbi:hypothetical protein B0J13DRAFT_539238 [Dactylonectria estremocensis]|uniref:Uncharacterized protein n=1 Tax=Dactylonectria estremocensis TaxID=1079267 RepID=A0A9P9FD28_9HYPO|nr:hypothetical protein B0J13DRAFT_539238 [Dactylonectria estremocensis]
MFTREETIAVQNYLESHIVKVLWLGQLGTGLDSILMRLVWDHTSISETYDPTTEDPTYAKQLHFGKSPVVLECQACPYAENTAIATSMAGEFEAHMYVFSVNSRASFNLLSVMHAKFHGPQTLQTTHCLFVVANKTDLPIESWQVSMQEAKEFSRSIGAELLSMSAKTGKGCGKDDAKVLATRVLLSRIRAKKDKTNGQYADKPADLTNKSNNSGALDKIVQRFRSFRKMSDFFFLKNLDF